MESGKIIHKKPIWYGSTNGEVIRGTSINDIFRLFIKKHFVIYPNTRFYFYKLKSGNVRTNEKYITPTVMIEHRGKHFVIHGEKYERVPPKYYKVVKRYD